MVGILVLLALVPAISAAAEIVVTTTQDGLPAEGGTACEGAPGEECTLREAIDKANENTLEADTITFTPLTAGDKLEVSENRLPPIYGQVTIAGDTAQGATAEVPALELEPVNFELARQEPGLSVLAGTGTRIEGLAIGGFGTGIELGPEEEESSTGTEICGDYIGTDLSGETAVPNEVGVEVRPGGLSEEQPAGAVIGSGDGTTCAGNVIAGNNGFGIVDGGKETTIGGNAIGIGAQPGGAELPNGSGGILETEEAVKTLIGGTGSEAAFHTNLIYNNDGPGVLVDTGAGDVSIRHDSFSNNAGLGIEVATDAPAPPTFTSTYSQSRSEFWANGTVTGTEGEEVELEFFGSPSCDSSGAGEGQTYLGGGEATIGAGGTAAFGFLIPVEVPRDDRAITGTMTTASGATSEFSTCSSYEPPPITIVVNTLGDSAHGGCFTTCSLREAIETANESPALDTIEFADSAEGVIKPQKDLPFVEWPVVIDGTTAAGYEGRPVVEIDGSEIPPPGEGSPVEGIRVEGAGGGSTVEGLAIGGFEYGVHLTGASGSRVCSSWIGVGLNEATLPNGTGVEVGMASPENQIGVGCPAGSAPNFLSGNSNWGILDRGERTEIGGNQVGVGPGGTVMPNGTGGGGGIQLVEDEASGAFEPVVGGREGTVEPNTIAYNSGPGVLVDAGVIRPQIRANSIFSNEGKGIEYGQGAPTTPTISTVTGQSGALVVSGTVTPGDDEQLELDFYASAICGPLSAGVGETYLGTRTVAVEPTKAKAYAESIATPVSDDELYITVTATGTQGTSEFSECARRPAPEHQQEETRQPTADGNPLSPQTKVFIPVNGEKVVVKPEAGKVKIKLPGTKKYLVLTELKEIPVGAVIDATNGRVKLTSISPDGTEQTAEFFGGVFRVKQKEGSGLVVLELLDTTSCPAPKKATGGNKKKGRKASPRAGASSVSDRPKKSKTAGELWGSGHGSFRTEGHAGSATVEGTIWLVEDRCNGSTFFKTRRGIVKVRDFIKHRSLPLPAGKTYLAGEE